MTINRKYICKFCGEELTVEADEKKFARFDAGEHIQDVFPELNVNERELMISGICGRCFDEMFDDEDDGECSQNEPFISKYDEKTDIFSDKYISD